MGFGRYRFRRSFGQVKAQFRGARPKFYPLFTGLLDTYAGAAAAYSLRRLSKIASSVVRVRRASDNAEKDFTADDITDNSMVNWVNGQIVPPLDIRELDSNGERTGALVEAAAAYSLRNLSSSYTGNVVDVRRSSDGEEDSFTAAEVADGTLTDWVVEDVADLIEDTMYFDGVDDYVSIGTGLNTATNGDTAFTLKADITTVSSGTNTEIISNQNTTGSFAGFTFRKSTSDQLLVSFGNTSTNRITVSTTGITINDGEKHTVQLDYDGSKTAAGVTFTVDGVVASKSVSKDTMTQSVVATKPITIGARDGGASLFWQGTITNITVVTSTYDGSSNVDSGWLDTSANSNNGTVNGSPALFTGQGYDGFVAKWYDQSGNANHATQGTDASQPKIVDGGSLVSTNGNPTVDFYNNSSLATGAFTDGSASSVFSVINNQSASATRKLFYSKLDFPNKGFAWNYRGDVSANQYDFVSYDGSANSLTFSDSTSPFHFVSSTMINGDKKVFINGTIKATSSDSFVADDGSLGIGSASFGTGFDIQEIIIYNTDQSDNRTAIEANIGDHYDIDLPSGVDTGYDQVDGFVETWYDQSGNGNDAVQDVAGSQPKIVDGGVLVTGGIDFDGVNDHFDFTGGKPITSIDAASAFFVGSSDSSSNQCGLNISSSTSSRRFYLPILHSGSFRFGYAGSITAVTLASPNTSEHLFTGIAGTSTASGYYDGELKGTVSSGTGVSGAEDIGSIGSAYRWDGRMREIIIYPSDQSANRAAIEANINNQYSIY